jgi:predicted porin
MNKKIIVAAIAAAVAAPMAAMADATVYGKIKVATQFTDRSHGVGDSWGLQDQVSRVGIKGSEDLGNGLKAIYKLEFGTDVASSFTWSGRNAYVGLAGGWGTALAGRHDTPLKISTGKLDLFGDSAADYNPGGQRGVGLFIDRRANSAIAYISPSMAGLTFAGAVLNMQNDNDWADGNSYNKDFLSGYSVAGMYSNGPWNGSIAYEVLNKELFGSNMKDDKLLRIGLGMLAFANFTVTGLYETHENINGWDNYDSDAWQLQAGYDIGNARIKGMYGDFDDKPSFGDGDDFQAWAVGMEYNLSKRTMTQVLYRSKDMDTGSDESIIALQLDHSF